MRGSSDLDAGLTAVKEAGKEGVPTEIWQRGVLEPALLIGGVSQLHRNEPILVSQLSHWLETCCGLHEARGMAAGTPTVGGLSTAANTVVHNSFCYCYYY